MEFAGLTRRFTLILFLQVYQKEFFNSHGIFLQQSYRFELGRHIHDDFRTQEYASTIGTVSPVLGDRKGQGFAVAAAVATEVAGEVGRSVHDNLSGTGR
jgi:hypothetical protein